MGGERLRDTGKGVACSVAVVCMNIAVTREKLARGVDFGRCALTLSFETMPPDPIPKEVSILGGNRRGTVAFIAEVRPL